MIFYNCYYNIPFSGRRPVLERRFPTACRPEHGTSAALLAAVDGVPQLAGRPGHLSHLPLRGRGRPASHLALLLRRLAALGAPVVPAAVDQELGHALLRALQVPVHHAHQDQALHEGMSP